MEDSIFTYSLRNEYARRLPRTNSINSSNITTIFNKVQPVPSDSTIKADSRPFGRHEAKCCCKNDKQLGSQLKSVLKMPPA